MNVIDTDKEGSKELEVEMKASRKRVLEAIVIKYKYLLRSGFVAFKQNNELPSYLNISKEGFLVKVYTLYEKCLKQRKRNAFYTWKENQRATLLEKITMLNQLNSMVVNKQKADCFKLWCKTFNL